MDLSVPRHRVLALAFLLLGGCGSPPLDREVRIADIHGLAVDPVHPSRLYVATHHGLFVAENDTGWAAVTREPFDMMGFTMHPNRGNVMYASGHPGAVGQGWAVGVVKSTDGGRTWSTLALKNEVDFHAMTMEAGHDGGADLVYGFHTGKIHHSSDGGITWSSKPVPFSVTGLATDPTDGELFAATDKGLQRIQRGLAGEWAVVKAGQTVGVAVTKTGLFAYFATSGLSVSRDAGATWLDMNWTVTEGDYPWGIAPGPEGSDLLYVGTARGSVFKTTTDGASWTRIR